MATKRRIRATRTTTLTPYMRKYLMGTIGESPPGPGEKVEAFMFRKGGPEQTEKLRALWIQHRDELMAAWKREGRKGKPWGSKRFDKKEKITIENE